MTDETLVFTRINGPIPNRGLAMHDINMFGLTYMQQISETSTGAGLHIEPGIWANVPHTTDPNVPPSVVRMASIPHGTVVLAQGVAEVHPGWPSEHPRQQHPAVLLRQPTAGEQRLQLGRADVHRAQAVDSDARSVSSHPGVTQAIVKNPNSVLQTALAELASGHEHEEQDVPQRVDDAQHHQGRRRRDRQHRVPGGQRQSPWRQREGRAGRGHLLDRDDRRHRRSARQASAAVHAAGDARLQRDPLAARHRRDAGRSSSRFALAVSAGLAGLFEPGARHWSA